MTSTIPASFLSNPNAAYHYDFVVATTQASINSAMKNFLLSLTEPLTKVCFVADDSGSLALIDYDTLLQTANGSDPFAVSATADPSSDPDLANLVRVRFVMGFQIQLGVPTGIPVNQLRNLPDIVTLGTDASSILFGMLCSVFTVVELQAPTPHAKGSWIVQSQPTDSVSDLWVFTSRVDLRLGVVEKGAYSTLPPDVKKQIKNMSSDAFSVQQLLFDLSNAGLETIPTVPANIRPALTVMSRTFLTSYFAALQKKGQPVVGCAVVGKSSPDASPLQLTDLNFEVDPLLDRNGIPCFSPTPAQRDLTTLNYLCAVDGKALPPAVKLPWNWIGDSSDNADHDGVVAINRNTLASYFRSQLTAYVKTNCILPHVVVQTQKGEPVYSESFNPGQSPNVSTPATGATVLSFNYLESSTDQAGYKGAEGTMTLTDNYSLTVDFVQSAKSDAQIVITQHQVIFCYVRVHTTKNQGNLVDIKVVDTYTIDVDENGKLVAKLQTVKTDNSIDPHRNGFLDFFTHINEVTDKAFAAAGACVHTNLEDMPISVVQNFVFPGGKTFIFKDANFSPHQDLVSYISYADSS